MYTFALNFDVRQKEKKMNEYSIWSLTIQIFIELTKFELKDGIYQAYFQNLIQHMFTITSLISSCLFFI